MQYLYKQFVPMLRMSETVWKCYRCNLSFKDKELAEMHNQITGHTVTKAKALAA